MKKLLCGAIAVCLVCAALVGCGKNGETAASVIADLKEKGVPISYSIVYDDATDPNGEGPHDYKAVSYTHLKPAPPRSRAAC